MDADSLKFTSHIFSSSATIFAVDRGPAPISKIVRIKNCR